MTASTQVGAGAAPDTLSPLTAVEPCHVGSKTYRLPVGKQTDSPRLIRAARAGRHGPCGSRSPLPSIPDSWRGR